MWNPLQRLFPGRTLTAAEYQQAQRKLLEHSPIPVIWMFGKTGSGKSSIVRYLTGVEAIEVGTGYRPQTRFSSQYDFPNETEPLMRFLDTRGLGEVDYDPAEDLAHFGDETHLVLVVVRAMDHAVAEIITALTKIRQHAPQRPVVLVLTALHDAYPGRQHPERDPFGQQPFPLPDGLPDNLRRSIGLQYERFQGLCDRAAPIDLTAPEEGFQEPHFGGPRLKAAVVQSLPAAFRQSLVRLDAVSAPLADLTRQRAMPVILGTSTLAATAAAVPLPWIDIPVVMALQTHLVYKLAKIHRQPIDAQTIAKVSGGLGGRIAIQLATRETLKFIPWIGIAVNAAAAFAYTYATGMVWNWYFTRIKAGHLPTNEELRDIFRNQLQRATELWKTTHAE